MTTYPTPGGIAPRNPFTNAIEKILPTMNLTQVVAVLNADGYSGASFLAWYLTAKAKDPALTPYNGASAWVAATVAGQDIAQGLGNAATGAGTAVGQAATGAAKGAIQAEQTLNPIASVEQFLSILTERSLWIRVGEVLLGLVLITAGTLKLAESKGAIGTVASQVTRINPATNVVRKGLKL